MSIYKVILPISYFGPISHYAFLTQFKECFFESNENYVKQSIRNRSYILAANGLQQLTVPVSKVSGVKSKITDIGIDNAEKWNNKHWNAIKSAYSSSPFFEYYADDFEQILKKHYTGLWELNTALINHIYEVLNIDFLINYTQEYIKKDDLIDCIDLRYDNTNYIVSYPEYNQVFSSKIDFVPDLSILDLIFNKGPEALDYLESLQIIKKS